MCMASASRSPRESAAPPRPETARDQPGSAQPVLKDQGEVEVVVAASGEVLQVLQSLDE